METEQPRGLITTEFVLEGQAFDPDAFSQVAGREPSKIWCQKRQSLKGNPAFAQIGWYFTLEKRPHWRIGDALRELLSNFEERREHIRAKKTGRSLMAST